MIHSLPLTKNTADPSQSRLGNMGLNSKQMVKKIFLAGNGLRSAKGHSCRDKMRYLNYKQEICR